MNYHVAGMVLVQGWLSVAEVLPLSSSTDVEEVWVVSQIDRVCALQTSDRARKCTVATSPPPKGKMNKFWGNSV